MKTQYGEKIDKHIYIKDGCKTPGEWLALAAAALDQAGYSIHHLEDYISELKEVRQ